MSVAQAVRIDDDPTIRTSYAGDAEPSAASVGYTSEHVVAAFAIRSKNGVAAGCPIIRLPEYLIGKQVKVVISEV